jgi:hypothetical protein
VNTFFRRDITFILRAALERLVATADAPEFEYWHGQAFSFALVVQTGSGANQACYSMCTGGFFF